MTKPAINELEKYLELVNKYFYTEPVPPFKKYPEDYYKDGYISITAEKVTNLETWRHLMDEFRQNRSIRSLRDMYLPDAHSFRAVLNIKNDNSKDRHVGIIVFVSFLGNYIGYYFSDTDGIDIDLKLRNPTFKPIQSGNVVMRDCSYFPINAKQEELLPEIIDTVKREFPGFSVFDNTFADYKVPQIQIDGVFFKKDIDLFQVIFSPEIHGVI